MKKMILLVVCLTMMGILRVNAQAAIAALHHEGKVTIYSSAQVAIDNSVNGDTIYLSEGMFGGFTINKGVAVIGSGMKTVVGPDIYIDGEDVSNIFLSNLAVVRNMGFVAGSNINSIKISQCKIDSECTFSGSATNVEFFMCHIGVRIDFPSEDTDNVTLINSKIDQVRYGGKRAGSVIFTNCNISGIDVYSRQGNNNFINCYIGTSGDGTYKNCLIYHDQGGDKSNCFTTDEWLLDSNLDYTWTDKQLRDSGYLGTDGTVVGVTGGSTPYTLASPVLRITDHNIEVDNEQRKLRVTLTLGTEE